MNQNHDLIFFSNLLQLHVNCTNMYNSRKSLNNLLSFFGLIDDEIICDHSH